MRAFIFVMIFCLPAICAAGQVYKWRDQNGQIHYSDVEPDKHKAQRKVIKSKDPKPLTAEEQAALAEKLALQKSACSRATKNMANLTSADVDIQMDLNNDGKPELLTAAQRAQQAEVMKARVALNCTQ